MKNLPTYMLPNYTLRLFNAVGIALIVILCAFLKPNTAHAQQGVQLFNIPHTLKQKPVTKTKQGSGVANRTEGSGEPCELPFFDDFSTSSLSPDTNLWMPSSNNVFVVEGIGLNAPSINVAVLDGADASGTPYNNNLEAIGPIDSLVSRPINLSGILPINQDRVYLSFYFQKAGLGNIPNDTDSLVLSFKDTANVWQNVWSMSGDVAIDDLNTEEFTQEIIQVNTAGVSGNGATIRYFHDDFQFKFTAYGSQTGAFDVWNIDYIFLGENRDGEPFSPDRALASQPTSLFNRYFAMPIQHFFTNPEAHFADTVNIDVTNLTEAIGGTGGEIVSLTTTADARVMLSDSSITNITDVLIQRDLSASPDIVPALGRAVFNVTNNFDLDQISTPIDSILSIALDYEFLLGSNDEDDEFFDSLKHGSIDFSQNDTLRRRYDLADYYAYDDGTAELGAGTNGLGSGVAYLYEMNTTEEDFVNSLDIYFPFLKTSTNNIQIQIAVWEAVFDDEAGIYLPGEDLALQNVFIQTKDSINQFGNYKFRFSAVVKDRFFIGFIQNGGANIEVPVGLDLNTNSADQVMELSSGVWRRADRVERGSLMMRPKFGELETIEGLEGPISNKELVKIYPNPSQGTFTIAGDYDKINVMDARGSSISFNTLDRSGQNTVLSLDNVPNGLYLIQAIKGRRLSTHKLIIRR